MGVSALMLKFAAFELLTLPRVSLLASKFAAGDGAEGRRVGGLKEIEQSNATGLFGEFYKNKRDQLVTLAPKVEDSIGSTEEDIERWEICADAFEVSTFTSPASCRVSAC